MVILSLHRHCEPHTIPAVRRVWCLFANLYIYIFLVHNIILWHEVKSLIGIIGYNLNMKQPHRCIKNKYILLFWITCNTCFDIVFYMATTFCPISVPPSRQYKRTRKIHSNCRYHKVLTCMQPVPPNEMPIKHHQKELKLNGAPATTETCD
jgi:hypothetical protein